MPLIDDHAYGRTRAWSAGQIFVRMNGDARAEGFETVDGFAVDVRDVRDGPSQVCDGRHGINLFEGRGGELIFGERETVLLERPTVT